MPAPRPNAPDGPRTPRLPAGGLRAAVGLAGAALAVGYPLLVYLGRERLGVRWLGLLALALVSTRLLWGWAQQERTTARAAALRLAPLALLWLGAVLLDDERLLMLAPAFGSVAFGLLFAHSLRPGAESWIERLARVSRRMDALPPTAIRHCRRVTALWSAFLIANGLVNAALALWAPVGWWAFYAGGLSYVLTALLFVAEWTYRTWRVAPVADREAHALGLVPDP